MNAESLRSIAIVGHGLAGMLSAAALGAACRNAGIELTLVPTPDHPDVDAPSAECSLPSLTAFHRLLGLSEAAIVSDARAAFRLGARYVADGPDGYDFINALGDYGGLLDGVAATQYALRLQREGTGVDLQSLAPGAVAARAGRYAPPESLPGNGWMSHGYVLDRARYTTLLAARARALGVHIAAAPVLGVRKDEADGVAALSLGDGSEIRADLYLDCTETQALLAGAFEPFAPNALPSDGFAWCESGRLGPPALTTLVRHHPLGLRVTLPLADADCQLLLFSTACDSADAAASALAAELGDDAVHAPRTRSATSGRRARIWTGNIVAMGAAAARLEPFEPLYLQLLQSALAKLISYLPARTQSRHEASYFNSVQGREIDRARDYLCAQYRLGARLDTPFWRRARTIAESDELAAKRALFSSLGRIQILDDETFAEPQWATTFIEYGLRPRAGEILAQRLDSGVVRGEMDKVRRALAVHIGRCPPHADLLAAIARRQKSDARP